MFWDPPLQGLSCAEGTFLEDFAEFVELFTLCGVLVVWCNSSTEIPHG